MCGPAIGMVAGLAGSAVSAMGTMSAANAQASQMEYNATVSKINARSNREEGYAKQEDIGLKADKLEGQSIAAAAGSGVDPFYGSAAHVIFGEGGQVEAQDKGRAYIAAESAAVGNENKARDLEAQAPATRKAGKFAAAGTFLSGLGSAISSGSKGGELLMAGGG